MFRRSAHRTTAGLATLVAAVVTATGLAGAPAHSLGAIPVTCELASGPVVELTLDDVDYRLSGTCGKVRVAANNVTVTAPTVRRLEVRGQGNTVQSKSVRTVVVSGRSNTVRPTSAEIVVVRGRNQRVRVGGLAEHVRIRTNGASFTAREVHDLVVKGHRNAARLRKIWSLRIDGNRNTVRARKLGDRAVSGRGNTVRARSRF